MNFYDDSSQGSMDIDEIVSGTSKLSIQPNQGDLRNVQRSCQIEADDDGLEEIWKEMALALELSKDVKVNILEDSEGKGECVHSVIMREDLGFVCQLCGIIETRIENIMGRGWDMDDLMSGGSSRQTKRDEGLEEEWREMALEIGFSKSLDGFYMMKPRIAMESENDVGDESVYLAARLQALSTSNA